MKKSKMGYLCCIFLFITGIFFFDGATANALEIDGTVFKDAPAEHLTVAEAAPLVETKRNLLVLLVEFEDQKIHFSPEIWHQHIFDKENKSLRHYYLQETGDRLDIQPVKETNTGYEGIIKVQLDGTHPNTFLSINEKNQQMVVKALQATEGLIDYHQYDSNGNGKIEREELHIMTIIAGYTAADSTRSPSVWGHQWAVYGENSVTVDDVEFLYYTQFGEQYYEESYFPKWTIRHAPATLGLIAHEFGHDLGIPDLYATGGGSTLSYTSLMANGYGYELGMPGDSFGGITPVGLDAYSKMLLGVPVQIVDTLDKIVTVSSIDTSDNQIYKVPTDNPKEYFLIDNRQLTGYDEAMKGHENNRTTQPGIGIYRVNEEYSSNKSGGKLVTLLEADQKVSGQSNLSGNISDPFFYKGKSYRGNDQTTLLTDETIPGLALEGGEPTGHVIEILSESSEEMDVFIGKRVPLTTIYFEEAEKEVEVGTAFTLSPAFIPENTSNKKVSWHSSDLEKAVVDSYGRISALSEGEVFISAKSEEGSKTASLKLIITEKKVSLEKIVIEQPITEMEPGESHVVTAALFPENTTERSIEWKSSEPSVAVIDSNGKISAISEGRTMIQAASEDGKLFDQFELIVYKHTVATSISILDKNEPMILYVNQQGELNCKVSPENATETEVLFHSSNPEAVSINEKGEFVVVGLGQSLLTASITKNSDIRDTVQVIVDDHGNQPEDATVLTLDNEISFRSDYDKDRDYFTFTAPEEGYYITRPKTTKKVDDYFAFMSFSSGSIGVNEEETEYQYVSKLKAGQTITSYIKEKLTNSTQGNGPKEGVEGTVLIRKVSHTIENSAEAVKMSAGELKPLEIISNYPPEISVQQFNFSSSNSEVVSVDKKGNLAAHKKGIVYISVQSYYASNNFANTLTVKVEVVE